MSDIYDMPGHLIRRMHQHSIAVFHTEMRLVGLDLTSVQFAALALLVEHPGVDQATLAQLIDFDRATIGGVIERLVIKGMVKREINPSDRRARMLSLTPKGRITFRQALPVVRRLQENILNGLDEDERRIFLSLSKKVVAGQASGAEGQNGKPA